MEMENVNKSQTDISKLHDDVLLEIFGHLHGSKDNKDSDLINTTLVCNKWNRLITEAPRLMDKLKLNVNFLVLLGSEFIHQDFKLTRPYRHATIAMTSFIDCQSEQNRPKVDEIFNQISSLKNLTTIKLYRMKLAPKLIEFLSLLKSLRVLVFEKCSYDYDQSDDGFINVVGVVKQFDFENLRQLKFTGGDGTCHHTEVLKHFKCKKLDIFVIQFLNELDRCDEIEVDVGCWYFSYDTIPLMPKFTWSKLKLSCYSRTNFPHEISSIEALCKASKPNAESEIELRNIDDSHDDLWPIVLNNCKGIKSLAVLNPIIPSNLAQLRLMPELRKLEVDRKTMEHANFFQLVKKLTGVSHLKIHQQYENQRIKLSPESAFQLQPFFNRIVELTLPDYYVRLQETEAEDDNESVSLLNIEFKNLRTLTVEDVKSYSLHNDHYDEKFSNFCTQTKSLNQLNIKLNVWKDSESSNFLQIIWYEKLHGTSPIQTCNILIGIDRNYPITFINWRKAEFDKVTLFGRMLTDDENRFFI